MPESRRPLIACLVVATLLALLQTNASGEPERISPEDLTKRLSALDAQVYYGGLLVNPGETVRGTIIVVKGSLDIQDGGMVDGDVWVVNGRLVMTGACRITGRVDLVNSERFSSRAATVSGPVAMHKCEGVLDAERYEQTGELTFIEEDDPTELKPRFDISPAPPSRVRYGLLQVGFTRENEWRIPDTYTRWRAMVDLPIYFDQPHGYLGFKIDGRVPVDGRVLGLVFAGYKTLHTEDSWQVSRRENGLFLLTAASEFADFYEKRGGLVGLEYRPNNDFTATLVAGYQQEVSMGKHRAFSITGNTDRLPDNPPITNGDRALAQLHVHWDTRADGYWPRNAWRLFAEVEVSKVSPDDVDLADDMMTTLAVGAYRYNRLPFGMQWDLGGRLFTAFDPIVPQLSQSLGGYGGVRGGFDAPFPTRRGDRLAVVSTELRKSMPGMPIVSLFFTEWNLVGFFDAGYLTVAGDPTDAFDFLGDPVANWRRSVGGGISGESFMPYVGLYVAKELGQTAREDVRVIFRLQRSF